MVAHTASTRSTHITEARINDRIRVPEVRLVGPNGEQVGIVRVEDALRLAQEADLDLVEVAPDARPPVCKLMDFGKFKYEADMKAREARRNQTNTVLKEIRFRLKIDPHDYGTKKGHVERFLKAGDKVKVMIMFRGREQSRPEMGIRLLNRLAGDVAELGFIESSPKQDGRNMIMVLGPTHKKADQKQEQRRAARSVETATESQAPAEVVSAPEPTPVAPVEVVPEASVPAPVEAAPAPAKIVPAPEPAAPAKPAATPKPATPRPAAVPRPVATPRPTPAARPAPSARPAAAKPVAATPVATKPVEAESVVSEAAPVATPAPAPVPTPKPAAARPTPAKPMPAKPAAPKPSAGGSS
ncbi:translation initiation factor IF-3 [Pengzhenrongella sp.]|uniref:translation initiation factor IF-3 n=1 Tax=Pengzhenrongella sp. TaxID=2888820 RepID=UPI002F92C09C